MDEIGFVWMKVIDGVHIDLPSLIEDAFVDTQLINGKKALALYDARAFFTITPEARDYVRSGILNKTRIATAVVTNKLAVRILVNFMNKFKKPKTLLKMFGNETDALKWLHSFRS